MGDSLTVNDKIQTALVECLQGKMKMEDITVAYLAKKAGVGKSTFYRHYKDIYDVYEQLVDGFIERCESLIIKMFFEKTLSVERAIWIFSKAEREKITSCFMQEMLFL